VKKLYPYLKNKFILTGLLFVLYALLLDDLDVFSIYRQTKKRNQIEAAKVDIRQKLIETDKSLNDLKTIGGKERYAREKKFFKKDNEEIFVITYN
jgi:cell division protein DivIC